MKYGKCFDAVLYGIWYSFYFQASYRTSSSQFKHPILNIGMLPDQSNTVPSLITDHSPTMPIHHPSYPSDTVSLEHCSHPSWIPSVSSHPAASTATASPFLPSAAAEAKDSGGNCPVHHHVSPAEANETATRLDDGEAGVRESGRWKAARRRRVAAGESVTGTASDWR